MNTSWIVDRRCYGSWLTIALAIFAASPDANAQDIEIEETSAAAAPNAMGMAVQNNWELQESNFDMWIYGNQNGVAKGRDRLDSMLSMSMEEIERTCHLSDAQKKKLLLAGQGDIKRFLDRVVEAHKVYERGRRDQNKINEIYQATLPLAETIRVGLYSKDSFFGKTLMSTLDPDQARTYRQTQVEKRRFRWQAKVRMAVANLDNTVGFTAEQRRKLVETILEQTNPPEVFNSQQDAQIVLVKIAKISDAKLKPLLDDTRWRVLKQMLQPYQGLEQHYKAMGLLDEATDEPAPAKPNDDGHGHD